MILICHLCFLQFPANSSESFLDSLEVESQKDYTTVLHEVLQGEFDDKVSGYGQLDFHSLSLELIRSVLSICALIGMKYIWVIEIQ